MNDCKASLLLFASILLLFRSLFVFRQQGIYFPARRSLSSKPKEVQVFKASMIGMEADIGMYSFASFRSSRNGNHSAQKHVPKHSNNHSDSSSNSLLPQNFSLRGHSSDTFKDITTPDPTTPAAEEPLLFYMYDLEEEFWWRWPAPNADCSANGYLGHEHAQLSGIGPVVIPENGLFLTWHFSLFNSLHNRLKRSRRRTRNPDLASMFVIPYDLGLDGYLDPHRCTDRRRCTRGLADRLMKNLSASPYFARHGGADHVVLWSLGQYHPWPHEQCDVFMMKFCARCSFTCYWMDPTKPDNKFVSVPFPSGYHWWDGIKNLPWDLSLAPGRNLVAVYLGSTQTLNPAHTKIRRAMTAQCNASKECHWKQIAHSSTDNKIADFLSIYKRAIFCLCPPGDDPARKAVFDAIISGCIPVIFEVATLYNQYPWHIGEQDALDISVSIPGGQVRSGKLDFMKVLLSIKPDVIAAKQRALARVAPRVQYAVPPINLLQDRFDETPWEPPFADAAELTLRGLFARTANMVANRSTGIPARLMSGREWSQEYDVVRIQVPRDELDHYSVSATSGLNHAAGQAGAANTSVVIGTSAATGRAASAPTDHSKAVEALFLRGDGHGHHGSSGGGGGATGSVRAVQLKRVQQERAQASVRINEGADLGDNGGVGIPRIGSSSAVGSAASPSAASTTAGLVSGASASSIASLTDAAVDLLAGPGEREKKLPHEAAVG